MNSDPFKVYRNSAIEAKDLKNISSRHELIHFSKGDMILKEGKLTHEYYLLESGLVRSYVHDYEGNEITTDFFGDNEIVIDVTSLFLKIPSQENIQCLTDCKAWKLDYDTFQMLYHTIPAFNEWGRAWMTYALHIMKKRSIDMVSLSALQRYNQLIVSKPQIFQFAPLKHIASYLGVTDTSLSRIRKEAVQ
ncbi:Crp/Fnr family transcriptional regulator [Sphingobacterium spiritivorum]|uniref:Crp/Fnr family transcriptional regulator n=1 Tax=Sphingobacterium spiritivorum TaxID=258 RepID=UPI00191A3C66|nr:Crp/Fnr family transcriptional regulator [Sphingobacterium spiritivorum]QQS96546.1 Crp/Fnr family transcriptional regulator [Sphingobacterium spiritivorum]